MNSELNLSEPLNFSKKQVKWVNIICVILCLFYEMYTLMDDDINTDITDGFFLILPIFLAVCVRLRCGIICFIPRVLIRGVFDFTAVANLVMQKNILEKDGISYDITGSTISYLADFCIQILPVLIFVVVSGIVSSRLYSKFYNRRGLSSGVLSAVSFGSSFLMICTMMVSMFAFTVMSPEIETKDIDVIAPPIAKELERQAVYEKQKELSRELESKAAEVEKTVDDNGEAVDNNLQENIGEVILTPEEIEKELSDKYDSKIEAGRNVERSFTHYEGFNPFTTLTYSLLIGAAVFAALTALIYYFRHKICDEE